MKMAIENIGYPNTFGLETVAHPLGQRKKIPFRIIAATNTRLIRHHDHLTFPLYRDTAGIENTVDYIEIFYNQKRSHGYANDVSPVELVNQYFNRPQSV